MPRPHAAVLLTLLGAALAASTPGTGFAQSFAGPRNVRMSPPLADTPAGAVGRRAVLLDPARRGFQTVAVSAAGGGKVEVYGVPFAPAIPLPAAANVDGSTGGARVRLCVGRTYRMRLTDVPGLPVGTALFPSVELIDRLHPPEGLADAFPLPVSVTRREAELAAAGVLITKAIYLEDPDLAPVTAYDPPLRRTDLPPSADPLAEGDLRGRVVAIVRLGGRAPDPTNPEPAFYGTGGPVLEVPAGDPNLPALPPVDDGITQVSASQFGGCPTCLPAPACPPVEVTDDGECRVSLGGCPTCPTCPDGFIPRVALPPRAPGGGFVLDTTLPGPYCPPEVRPRDEYLCDGGDRGRPAGSAIDYSGIPGGLGLEDTVVRFRDSAGELQICETNKVCVYAPRFAEVRTFFGTVADTRTRRPRDLARTARGSVRVVGVPTGIARQDVRPAAADVRERVSGLIAEQPWSGLSDVLRRRQATILTEPLDLLTNDRANLRTGLTAAQLAAREDAAAVWTRSDNPVVLWVGEGTAEAINTVRPQVMVGLEDQRLPGRLCVRKFADKRFAAPGDVVTFTITLENLGEKPLSDVVVLDNLTPRLGYVEGSGAATLPGEIEVTPNGEGSGIVRFVLTEPLEGGAEGKLTFRTIVR